MSLFVIIVGLLALVCETKTLRQDPFKVKGRRLPYETPKWTSSSQYETDYGDGSCHVRHFTCLTNNDDNLIISKSLPSPYDCCKTCLNYDNCQSWSHYYINQTSTSYLIGKNPICELYSNYPNDSDHISTGNCVIGSPYGSINSSTGSKLPKRLNYVIFFPDTIRKESMSTYGHPLKTTPNIDKFVSNGNGVVVVVFKFKLVFHPSFI